MPRSRIVKPEFWNDEKLARVSRDARLTFIGIWTCSDDFGVTKGNEAWLKSQIYPYEDSIKLARFIEWLSELEKLKVIIPFMHHQEKYYYIKNFSKHQKVDHPSKNRNPAPPENIDSWDLADAREEVASDSRELRDEYKQNLIQTEYNNIYPSKSTDDFILFWNAYPKKVGKSAAKRAWGRLNGKRPDIEAVITKIEELKKCDQWTEQGGKFVPNPATWLNRGGWEDELPKSYNEQAPTFWNQSS